MDSSRRGLGVYLLSLWHLCIVLLPCQGVPALLWECGHSPEGDETGAGLLHWLGLISSVQFPNFKTLGSVSLVILQTSPAVPGAALTSKGNETLHV